MRVRAEQEHDWPAVHALNTAAFSTSLEARLVESLRREVKPVISLVAEDASGIIGHILFAPVTLTGHAEVRIMGLAPMAVLPDRQRQGIGAALVRAGLECCREIGFGAVVVVGHPEYYPRFGFLPGARFGIRCEYDVPDEAFMVIELHARYLAGRGGVVKYHVLFPSA